MQFLPNSQGVDAWWQMRVFAMVESDVFVGVKQCISNKEHGWQVVSPYGMCLANCADFVRETLCICEFFILTLPFKVTVLTKKRHSRVLLGIHWGFSLTKKCFYWVLLWGSSASSKRVAARVSRLLDMMLVMAGASAAMLRNAYSRCEQPPTLSGVNWIRDRFRGHPPSLSGAAGVCDLWCEAVDDGRGCRGDVMMERAVML